MNFWSDSVQSQGEGESFYLNIDTPRGYLFVVLGFGRHDYVNLNASLESKLETITSSFDSVPDFSADLLLTFLAREVNNFIYQVSQQSSDDQLLCSGALGLINSNRFAYVVCGDSQLILPRRNPHSLRGEVGAGRELDNPATALELSRLPELGSSQWEAPLTGRVPAITLQEDDVVLITTQCISEDSELFAIVEDPSNSEATAIGEALTLSDEELGNVLIISGPYNETAERRVERPVQLDSAPGDSGPAGLVHELMEKAVRAELDQRVSPLLDELKNGLRSKAESIDVLELNQILKNLSASVTGKADTAELLELRRDLLKLTVASRAADRGADPLPTRQPTESVMGTPSLPSTNSDSMIGDTSALSAGVFSTRSSFGLGTAVLVLLVAIGGAFIGAWLQSRILKKTPEVWAVKAAGSQIWINRMDSAGQGNVTLNLAAPVRSRGEQTFSSFADVKQYIDAITVTQPSADPPPSFVANEVEAPEKKQSEAAPKVLTTYADPRTSSSADQKISVNKSPRLNAAVRKSETRTTKRAQSPSSSTTGSVASLKRDRRVSSGPVSSATPVTVAHGDTLIKLANRYKTTPDQLKKLNPQIDDPAVIRMNQKILVPGASTSKDSKGKGQMLVKRAH